MENFFEKEGPHGAAGIPYCRIEVDDKASLGYGQLCDCLLTHATCDVLFRSQQSQALVPHFNIAIEFIHSAIKKGGRVLAHCAMGQSRSLPVSQCVFVFPSSDVRYCGGSLYRVPVAHELHRPTWRRRAHFAQVSQHCDRVRHGHEANGC